MTSEILHSAFGLFCHQAPERSPEVLGTALLCYRCLGTFAGLLGSVLVIFRRSSGATRLSKSDAWILGLAFAPLAIDGTANAIGIWSTPGLVRLLTGLLLGSALGLLVHISRDSIRAHSPRSQFAVALCVGALTAALFVLHPWVSVFIGMLMLAAASRHLLLTMSLVVAGLRGPAAHSWYRSVD